MEVCESFVEVEVGPRSWNTSQLVAYCIPQKGTGIPSYPETCCEIKVPTLRPFRPTRIEVAEECADAFVVHQCLIGQVAQWRVNERGVDARILNKRPDIRFGVVSDLFMSLLIQNKLDKPAVFKAKVFGETLTEKEIAAIEAEKTSSGAFAAALATDSEEAKHLADTVLRVVDINTVELIKHRGGISGIYKLVK